MSYKDKAAEMYDMIGQGKGLDAFEKFYAENVNMIECTGDVRKGKDENRLAQQAWVNNVQEFHGVGVNNITSNEAERTTMVETWFDFTPKGGAPRMKMEQIARQKWNADGQIEEERFYYDTRGFGG